jgi:predicted RecB family nuclease
MAALEAIALAKALGTKTGTVQIVHGEKPAMVSVNAAALSRAVHRKVSQIASLLSAVSPPDTVVNRHCPECGFHDRSRKDAVGKDELSLLSNLTGKERAKYRGKGIFTVSQLAYVSGVVEAREFGGEARIGSARS